MPYTFNPFTIKLDYYESGTAGSGDVVGPSVAVNNNVVVFDSTTGKLIKDSGASLSNYLATADLATAVPANETDPVFTASQAFSISSTDITNLGNLSGTNSGDQVGDGVTITGAGTAGDPFVAVGGGVSSIKKTGETALTGDITLSQGTGVTLTQSGNDISISASGGSSGYTTDFDNSDLASGILTVTHNLGTKYHLVAIYNNSDALIIPDGVTLSSTSALTVDLTTFGTITGTWNVVVI